MLNLPMLMLTAANESLTLPQTCRDALRQRRLLHHVLCEHRATWRILATVIFPDQHSRVQSAVLCRLV